MCVIQICLPLGNSVCVCIVSVNRCFFSHPPWDQRPTCWVLSVCWVIHTVGIISSRCLITEREKKMFPARVRDDFATFTVQPICCHKSFFGLCCDHFRHHFLLRMAKTGGIQFRRYHLRYNPPSGKSHDDQKSIKELFLSSPSTGSRAAAAAFRLRIWTDVLKVFKYNWCRHTGFVKGDFIRLCWCKSVISVWLIVLSDTVNKCKLERLYQEFSCIKIQYKTITITSCQMQIISWYFQ